MDIFLAEGYPVQKDERMECAWGTESDSVWLEYEKWRWLIDGQEPAVHTVSEK